MEDIVKSLRDEAEDVPEDAGEHAASSLRASSSRGSPGYETSRIAKGHDADADANNPLPQRLRMVLRQTENGRIPCPGHP